MDPTVKGGGPATGLAAARALLLRQTRKRFGEACAEALTPLLEIRNTPEELPVIGEWIVTYDTGEALLAKARGRSKTREY
jgi:hypothetical protein